MLLDLQRTKTPGVCVLRVCACARTRVLHACICACMRSLCSACVHMCSVCVLHVCACMCACVFWVCACVLGVFWVCARVFCMCVRTRVLGARACSACVRACVRTSKCLLLSRSFKAFPELCSLPRCVRRRQPAVGREGGEEGPSLPCTNTRSLFASLMPCPWGVSLGCGAKEGTEFSKLSQHQIDRNSRR